jgi:hypothetical protein
MAKNPIEPWEKPALKKSRTAKTHTPEQSQSKSRRD